jgi:hypothetical protein
MARLYDQSNIGHTRAASLERKQGRGSRKKKRKEKKEKKKETGRRGRAGSLTTALQQLRCTALHCHPRLVITLRLTAR